MNKCLRATRLSHLLMSEILTRGQTAVDATAGNGLDTLFLAQTVGAEGKVYAFDIQSGALEETARLLAVHQCQDTVELINDNHENIGKYVQEPVHGLVYNLGYLPGGDKTIITKAGPTLHSLKQGVQLLAAGGVISVVVYPGHPGGAEEGLVVEEFLKGLPSPPWHVFTWRRINGRNPAPFLLLAQKD